jgi:hypothetical protein
MSEYDDDSLRLSDVCDNCGELFIDCTCDEDDEGDEVTTMLREELCPEHKYEAPAVKYLEMCELKCMADDAEAQRKQLDWPYLLRVTDHAGLGRAVVTVASFDHAPVAAMLPLAEALELRKALDSVIEAMRKREAAP